MKNVGGKNVAKGLTGVMKGEKFKKFPIWVFGSF
jgi:hypothetical protein